MFLPFDPQWNPSIRPTPLFYTVTSLSGTIGGSGHRNTANPQIPQYRKIIRYIPQYFKREALRFRFCGFGQFLVRFLQSKIAVFRFWCLVRFAGFLQFSLWFSVFVNHDGGFFRFVCQMHFTVFLVLSKKLHPAVQLYHKPSLCNLAATIWVVMTAKQIMRS